MIVLFTDFGLAGPYVGQMKAVLATLAPGVPVIDLMADAPAWDVEAAAYLLAAFGADLPSGTVLLCVVDPGVGGPRRPLAVEADGRWYVGPDNGLFEPVLRRAAGPARAFEIVWRPERLSGTFHGRDLFAPVAAGLATGRPADLAPLRLEQVRRPDWPDDLDRIVYVDAFGNAMTGLRAGCVPADARLKAGKTLVSRQTTFSDVPPGSAFWYENSSGLVEIAVNRGRADRDLGLRVGQAVEVVGTV